MKEIWKYINGFEEKYQVSNLGQIKSLNYNNTNREKILKPKMNKQGSLEITLNKCNKHHYFMINRLVIETFTNRKLTRNDIVMYQDENSANCSLNNLYIISRGQRQQITYEREKRYRVKHEYYGEILSIKEIAKRNSIKPNQIYDRLRKLYWNIYEASEIPISIYKKENRK